jgi:signal peptidase II
MSLKSRAALLGLALAFPLDVLTKWLVNENLAYGDQRTVIEGFFYLTHVRNTGAAFGLFADGPKDIRLSFFIGTSVIAIGIIVSFYRKLAPGEWLSALALGFILGGALGNLRDRVVHHEVVDFLHFKLWGGYSWPDFNLADSFIVVGVAVLLLELLASEGETSSAADGGSASSA